MKKVNVQSKTVLASLMATENLTVEHRSVSTASFDVKSRTLTLPVWKDMSNILYEGFISHEVGHALFTPFEEWSKFFSTHPTLKNCANVIEDARIEKLMKAKYPGLKRTMHGLYTELSDRNFFGTADRELDSYNIIDRVNLHFKLGLLAQVPFSDSELDLVAKIEQAETFQDVMDLTLVLGEMAKEEKDSETEQDHQLSNEEDNDDDADEEEGKGEDDESATNQENAEDEDDDADEEEGKDQSEEEGEEELECETQKEFDSSADELVDGAARDNVYVQLPKVDYKRSMIGYKEVIDDLSTHFNKDSTYTRYSSATQEYVDQAKAAFEEIVASFKADTNPVVSYMVREFEMKQAAQAHHRTTTSKTGVLDTNKMHSYKINDDIFKTMSNVADGKSHGLIMYIDWSGSMNNKLYDTLKQMLGIVMFARKVGIPFRVCGFSSALGIAKGGDNSFYLQHENTEDHVTLRQNTTLIEFFNEKMNAIEFNSQISNVLKLGMSINNNRNDCQYDVQCHDKYYLASTPLNETIIAAFDHVEDFRKETGREKINTIFLTDGDSDGNDEYTKGKDRNHVSYNEQMIIKRGNVVVGHTGNSRTTLTTSLLETLEKEHRVNVIGFHIAARSDINHKLYRGLEWDEVEAAKKVVTKIGYYPLKTSGYTTYFLINQKNLDKKVDMGDDDTKSKSKAQLRSAFKRFSKGRKVNKMMLNEFVSLIS